MSLSKEQEKRLLEELENETMVSESRFSWLVKTINTILDEPGKKWEKWEYCTYKRSLGPLYVWEIRGCRSNELICSNLSEENAKHIVELHNLAPEMTKRIIEPHDNLIISDEEPDKELGL